MAQIVKSKEKNNIIDLDKKNENNISKNNKQENIIKNKSSTKNIGNDKNGLWTKFMIFCHGVRSEVSKVRWTSKQDMLKYSIATIAFIVFCSLFFYGIDAIFALIQSLVKGV